MTSRRQFIRKCSAAGIVSLGGVPPTFVSRAWAEARRRAETPDTGRVLVLVQLAGGNDGLNTVIPYGDAEYAKSRPGIGISRRAVLKIDEYVGLHPGMPGFKRLFDEGSLAIVQGVGYPRPNRSHFRSTDIWHSGWVESEAAEDGWLGRALDLMAERHAATIPAMALGTERLPLALVASRVNVPTVRDLAEYQLQLGGGSDRDRRRRGRLIRDLASQPSARGSDLEFLRGTARTAIDSAERLKEVTSSYRPSANYPSTGLAAKLKLVAQLIASELGTRIFFVSLGGFDTHAQQAGAHQALLVQLSGAVNAFFADLAGHGLSDRVLLATYSEFGRRVKENGSLGTDHGAASQMFIVNPSGKGGLHGAHPSLTDLDQGDLKYHTDFRRVYATILRRWLEFPSTPVLGRDFEPLDIA